MTATSNWLLRLFFLTMVMCVGFMAVAFFILAFAAGVMLAIMVG
jgi:hypothetical protein